MTPFLVVLLFICEIGSKAILKKSYSKKYRRPTATFSNACGRLLFGFTSGLATKVVAIVQNRRAPTKTTKKWTNCQSVNTKTLDQNVTTRVPFITLARTTPLQWATQFFRIEVLALSPFFSCFSRVGSPHPRKTLEKTRNRSPSAKKLLISTRLPPQQQIFNVLNRQGRIHTTLRPLSLNEGLT